MMSLPHARRLLSAAGAGSALGVALLAPAVAHASVTQNFSCIAGATPQLSTAPLGAVSAIVTLKGAAGQTPAGGGAGGNGETLSFTMPASTQQQFSVNVGCQNGVPDGGAGGTGFAAAAGKGGGASYLTPAGAPFNQALGVAGGGGGGGEIGNPSVTGGAGGQAGVNGSLGGTSVTVDGSQFGGNGGQALTGIGGGLGSGTSFSGHSGGTGVSSTGGTGGGGASITGFVEGGGGGGGGGGWIGGGGGGGGGGDNNGAGAGGGGGGGAGGTDHLDSSVTAVGSPAFDVTGDGSVSVTYTAIGQVIGQVPTAGGFSVVATGQTASETVTFSQLGTSQDDPASLGQASITQTGGPFSITADTCSNTALAVTATCSITVSATSPTAALLQGTLTLPNNGVTGAAAVPLFADVVPPATALVRPKASESFGSVPVGQTQDKTFSVTDTGGLALTIGQASVTGSPDFAIVPDQDFCSRWVVTASSCTLQVAYTPSAAGAATATLNLPSSDPATPVSMIALSGAGTASSAPTAPPATPTAPAPPALLSHSASSLTLGKRHAHITFGFTLSQPSTVVVTLQRRAKGRWTKVGVTRFQRAAGGRSFVLGQRFAGHRLTAGEYRVVLQTRSDGPLSSPIGQVITVKRTAR